MDEKEKEARLRRASERLYGDTRLREGLADEQAEQLLAWGFAQVERQVAQATEESAPAVDAQVEAVHNALQVVSRMARQLPEASDAQSREYVGQLVDALCEVDTRSLQINDMMVLEALADRRETLTSAEIGEQLLEIVRSPREGDAGQTVAGTGETMAERMDQDEENALAVVPQALADSGGEEEE